MDRLASYASPHADLCAVWRGQSGEVLARHGGTVAKFIGDAVMAVYGVPRLHEDDALRAVRGAAELGDALAELNGELEAAWGVRLALRTGVNTGEVGPATRSRGRTSSSVTR